MSRTTRVQPTSGGWMRRMRYQSYRRAETIARNELAQLPGAKRNRLRTVSTRIVTDWDDLTVSYWRGQRWARL